MTTTDITELSDDDVSAAPPGWQLSDREQALLLVLERANTMIQHATTWLGISDAQVLVMKADIDALAIAAQLAARVIPTHPFVRTPE